MFTGLKMKDPLQPPNLDKEQLLKSIGDTLKEREVVACVLPQTSGN